MIVSAFMEVISIGAIIPFLAVLTAPENLMNNDFAADFIQYMGILTSDQLAFPITIIFISAILIANTLRLLLLRFSTKLAFMAGHDLSFEVYSRTLYQPYLVHIQRNSSEVITGITNKVGGVVFGALLPVLTFISAFILLVIVITSLVIIEPAITLITVFGFGLIYVAITMLTRKKLAKNSRCIAEETTKLHKALQEGLGGIREVLLDGTQKLYCDIYRKADFPLRQAQGNNVFIAGSPKFAMEALGVTLIAVIANIYSNKAGGIAMVIPVLGAIALGAQRMLPALQNCYASWSAISGNQASILDALILLEQPVSKNIVESMNEKKDFTDEIDLNSVSFQYNKESPWVLNGVNLNIKKGERIGFVGETGSGKSTILDLIMGLLEPGSGMISIDGKSLTNTELLMWRQNIAHVPQTIFLIDSSIAENIALGAPKELIDIERVKNAAKQAQISDFIESNQKGYDAQVGERGIRLSGGQRQRIGIARALYKEASVLIFDEATSALDDKTEKLVINAIEKLNRGITVIFIAHRLTTLRNCDRIIELKDGKVLNDDSYEKMLAFSPSFHGLREHAN